MKRNLYPATALLVLSAVGIAGCEAKKSQNPLSPTVAGPIAGVSITPPRQLEPAQGFRVKESQQPLRLVIENSTTTGVRPITYSFEVATDNDFQAKVFARNGVAQGDGGRTSVTVDRLDLGRAYYWRVQADDGANQSTYSTASFEVLPKPFLDAPLPLSPINAVTVGGRRPELKVRNSNRNEAVGFLFYAFQISTNTSFTALVSAGHRDEGGSTTEYIPGDDLAANTTYFWRSASTDGESTSPWSGVQSFRTPGAPAPGPSPGPGPAPGGPCNSSNPEEIIACERSKFGFMDEGQIVQFLAQAADSLNRNNIPGGRFGLLVKTTGSQCNGFSCDIICSGNGGGQRQWDVLIDSGGAQSPTWHEVGGITVRVCQIR